MLVHRAVDGLSCAEEDPLAQLVVGTSGRRQIDGQVRDRLVRGWDSAADDAVDPEIGRQVEGSGDGQSGSVRWRHLRSNHGSFGYTGAMPRHRDRGISDLDTRGEPSKVLGDREQYRCSGTSGVRFPRNESGPAGR